MPVVITDIVRPDPRAVAVLSRHGVATVHEAQGRLGLMAASLRPIFRPVSIAGPAVTCEVPPGDNWGIHVAVEQCQAGDVLVVSPTSACEDGYFGELLATSLQSRGVRGLVINASVRDIAALTAMHFPVWSKAVYARGCIRETPGNINVRLVCAGAVVEPGDVIVADDDGVCVVPLEKAAEVAAKADARAASEELRRVRFQNGELGLDIYDMRSRLAGKGLIYKRQKDA